MSEDLLRYWREEPLLSEHHEHWHLVYPYEGRVDEAAHTKDELKQLRNEKRPPAYKLWNDRHGELFAYMHAQFLARYAAERLSVGLPAVRPLDDYRQPIADGYSPHPDLAGCGKIGFC